MTRGYAVGLVARAPKRGSTLFGYFFGPLRIALPSREELHELKPVDAVLVARFVDKGPTWAGTESGGLASGAWPVIASSDAWEREAWPMPEIFLPYYDEPAVARWSEDIPAR